MSDRFVVVLRKICILALLIGIGGTGWSGQANAEVGQDCPWVENWEDEEGVLFFGFGILFAEVEYASTGRKLRRMFIDCGSHPDVVEGLKFSSRRIRNSRWRRRLYTGLGGYLMWQYGGQEPRSDVVTVTPFILIPALFVDLGLSGAMESRAWTTSELKRFRRSFRDFQTQAYKEQKAAQALLSSCHSKPSSFAESFKLAEDCKSLRLMLPESPTTKPWLAEMSAQADSVGQQEIAHLRHHIESEFSKCQTQKPLAFGDMQPEAAQEALTHSVQCKQQFDDLIRVWDGWGTFSKEEAVQADLEAARIAISKLRESIPPFQQKMPLLHCQASGAVVLSPDDHDAPDPDAKEWEEFFHLCSAAVESWPSDWSTAERDQLNGWIQTGREKQATLLAEKERREAAAKALREKQEAEEAARKKKAAAEKEKLQKKRERERDLELQKYRSECKQHCKTWGRKTWVCVEDHRCLDCDFKGSEFTARSHEYRPKQPSFSKHFARWRAGMDLECRCRPADKSLPSICKRWEVKQ